MRKSLVQKLNKYGIFTVVADHLEKNNSKQRLWHTQTKVLTFYHKPLNLRIVFGARYGSTHFLFFEEF